MEVKTIRGVLLLLLLLVIMNSWFSETEGCEEIVRLDILRTLYCIPTLQIV